MKEGIKFEELLKSKIRTLSCVEDFKFKCLHNFFKTTETYCLMRSAWIWQLPLPHKLRKHTQNGTNALSQRQERNEKEIENPQHSQSQQASVSSRLDRKLVSLAHEEPIGTRAWPDHTENIKQISNTLTSLIEYYQFGHLYSMLLANKNKEISHKKNCTFYFFVIKNGTIVRKTDRRPPRDNSWRHCQSQIQKKETHPRRLNPLTLKKPQTFRS
jgi:hypothetical protein